MAQKVLVQHEPKYNGNGDVIGVAYRKHGHVVQDVHQEYIHRDEWGNRIIRTSSGDTWSVRPTNNPNYQFVTV